MVTGIVQSVLADTGNRRISMQPDPAKEKKEKKNTPAVRNPSVRKPSARKKKAPAPAAGEDAVVGKPCPVCGKGTVIKGKTAYGCSRWKEGCTFRQPFGE